MKKQLVLLLTVVGTFIAAGASAQPYFSARIGIRLPQPRVFCAPPPPPVVVYQQPVYDQPGYDQPVYAAPAPTCYDNTVVYENRRPVYYRNGYGPRYVEVDRYRDHRDYRGYHDDRYRDYHRDGGYHRW